MNPNNPNGPFNSDNNADEVTSIRTPRPGGVRANLLGGGLSGQLQAEASPIRSNPSPAAVTGAVGLAAAPDGFALPKADFQKNRLVAEALPLLSLAGRLRQMAVYPAIDELRQRLSAEISGFENRLLQAGVGADQVRVASYLLCAFLDETINNTPWGVQNEWGQKSLLISFHREAWGGERFFALLDGQVKQPAQNLDMIELAYLFLSLGFEGKYRIIDHGAGGLDKIRLELFQLIQRVRGDFERELSPRWQGLRDVRNALVRYVPLWVVGAGLGLLLLLAYLGFMFALNGVSDQVFRDLSSLAKQPVAMASPLPAAIVKPPMPERRERFKQLLSTEIAGNMVEVVDDRLLRVRDAFPSGSDQIKPEYIPMLKKIAAELATSKEALLVTGHTDDKAIATARFPSNWHLSKARAKAVGDMLAFLAPLSGRIRIEGRADGEPLVANDSNEHRAVNRRVDLLIQ